MIVSNLGSFFLIVLVWFPKFVQRQILFQLCSGLDASIFLCIFAVCFPCSRNVVESAGACSRGVRPWFFAKGPLGRTYIMSWNLVHLYGAPWKTDLARSWSERVFWLQSLSINGVLWKFEDFVAFCEKTFTFRGFAWTSRGFAEFWRASRSFTEFHRILWSSQKFLNFVLDLKFWRFWGQTHTVRRFEIKHEIPRNSTKFHEIPRNSTKFHEIPRTFLVEKNPFFRTEKGPN